MKKMLVSAFAAAMLSSSVAFADADKLSAFQGVETAAVSAAELNQVSGEGLLGNLLGNLLLNDLGGIVNTVLGDVLGLVGGLGLLNGLAVNSNTSVDLGNNVITGATGLNSVNLSLGIN